MTREELQDHFGFIEGETKCRECGEILTRDNAHWGFGTWWHNKVKGCKK